jgi:undecaprenyl diphosphate synthase
VSAHPRHVAIIMDGNGRWAERRGLPRAAGHERGAEAVRRTVTAARNLDELGTLTLFAFSQQNWGRPSPEVAQLMALFAAFLVRERQELVRTGVRLRAIGDRALLPPEVQAEIAATERATAGGGALTLCIAVSYGGREDLVRAAQALVRAAAAGTLAPGAIDEDALGGALSTAGLPPVDLVIRTSGEQRLSNFLLWEAAYAELYFTPCLWPDFGAAELQAALASYSRRERRFGLVPAPRGLEEEARAAATRR